MHILIGILFIVLGLVMLVSPKTVFEIVESWKGSNYNEPSALYCASIRVGGGFYLIIGIACIIISLLNLI